MSNRIYLSLILFSIFVFFSCTKKEKSYTRQEVRQKTDSILSIEIKNLRRQAKEDLDRRLPIELKPKVDSILKISYKIPPPPEIEGDTETGKDTIVAKQAGKEQ